MEEKKQVGYVPGPDFKEDRRPALFDIHMNEDTELWLVQLPNDQFPDFGKQEITLDLDKDGEIGSIKGIDGKVYSLVNFPCDVAETTIFQPSETGTRIVGKISRHVSLVRFPEPDELVAQEADTKKTPMTSKTTYTKSRFTGPSPSMSMKTQQSRNRKQTTHSSSKDALNSKGNVSERSTKSGQSTQDSGHGHSTVTHSGTSRGNSSVTVSGSSEQSHRKKSKTRSSEA